MGFLSSSSSWVSQSILTWLSSLVASQEVMDLAKSPRSPKVLPCLFNSYTGLPPACILPTIMYAHLSCKLCDYISHACFLTFYLISLMHLSTSNSLPKRWPWQKSSLGTFEDLSPLFYLDIFFVFHFSFS